MYTIRQILGQTLGLTKSGVRWYVPGESSKTLEVSQKTPKETAIQAVLDRIQVENGILDIRTANNAQSGNVGGYDIPTKLAIEVRDEKDNTKKYQLISEYFDKNPTVLVEPKNGPTSQMTAVEAAKKPLASQELKAEVKVIEVEAKTKESTLQKQALENTDFVKNFGNRVNLGSVSSFVEAQTGATTKDKIQAAFNKAKSNTTRSDAGSAINIDTEYAMKSKMSDKQGTYLSEYNALTNLLESMLKSESLYAQLKAANIPSDRKVDPTKLTDLFSDLDDDGVIEAVNSKNDAGLLNKIKGFFVDNDAMQSEYLGEHQAARKSKDDATLRDMLKTTGIEQNSGEDLAIFAKRARAALLISASTSGTAELDPKKALTQMQKSDEYIKQRSAIEKKVTDLQKSISDKNPTLKAEDINKIARSLTSTVMTYVATAGVGTANADAIMTALGKAVTTSTGNVLLLGVDMGVMANVVDTERFKASLGAGIGGGVSSEGVFAFAHVDATGKLTILDRSNLEELKKTSGNATITLGAHAGVDLQSMRVVPSLSLDALWNDRIDTLDNSVLKMSSIIDKLTKVGSDGKSTIDLSVLPAKLDPILRSQLQTLKYLTENADATTTVSQQNAHAILLRDRFMKSFRVFMAAQPDIKGLSLAGVKFAIVPGALLAGPVFQDISVERIAKVVPNVARKADTAEMNAILTEAGLKWDETTRTLTRTNISSKIELLAGLTEKGGQIVFPEGKMPKYALAQGVENTLGGTTGEKILSISSVDKKTTDILGQADKIPKPVKLAEGAKVILESSREAIPANVTTMIQSLAINKLIDRADVKRFMAAMTAIPEDLKKSAEMAAKVPEFKAILKLASIGSTEEAKFQNLVNAMTEIDEKLVGDLVTRGFNDAKSSDKAFATYKKLLASRGVKLTTRDKLTLGDIAPASYNKASLRDQELTLIANASGIAKETLATADKKMLDSIKNNTSLTTEGSGYMLMARNRVGAGLQGSRRYETGSYIAKTDLGLTPEQNIASIQKTLGLDLMKIALTNLAARPEFTEYKAAIANLDSTKIILGADGKVSLALPEDKVLHVDLSGSTVYSALYGDTKMNNDEKSQAVCVNVGLLLEPSVSGSITGIEMVDGEKKPIKVSAPEMDISGGDTVMPGQVSQATYSVLGVIAKPQPKPEETTTTTTPPGDTDKKPKPQPAGNQDTTAGGDKTPVKPDEKPPSGSVTSEPVKPVGPKPPDKKPDPGTAVDADK